MAVNKDQYENVYSVAIIFAAAIVLINLYYYCNPLLREFGYTLGFIDKIIFALRKGNLFTWSGKTKLYALILLILSVIVRHGRETDKPWSEIIGGFVIGLGFFLIPFDRLGGTAGLIVYPLATITGFIMTMAYASLAGRKVGEPFNAANPMETFEQFGKLLDRPYSINYETKYFWRGKWNKGYVNVVNPFRATLILGTPGSGKSFSVFNPAIAQTLSKGYTMFTYDYKFPDLSNIVYNELYLQATYTDENGETHYRRKELADMKTPKFYVINFDDPRRTNRGNPLQAEYLKDVADASEIADVIWKNVSPGVKEDFFSQSAREYIGSIIWFLSQYSNPEIKIYDTHPDGTPKVYKNDIPDGFGGILHKAGEKIVLQDGIEKGDLCTFPHFIELIGQNYEKVFTLLRKLPELENKIAPFADALDANAQDQLQGQIASARIPLNKMASPELYWVLTGNDFTLDINNPDDPKVICVGNNPDRQSIYGTALALFTSRLFKLINHKGKRPSAVILDEMPTVYIKDIDQLIATARSNKVAMFLGAQDKSQLVRDYKKDYADVVFNTVGNIFAGQVNGETARSLSQTLGKEKRLETSRTLNSDDGSRTQSYRDEELLPQSRIETLTQGWFFGKVADNNDDPIDKKFFCGEFVIDVEGFNKKMKNAMKIPLIDDFGEAEIKRLMEDPAVYVTSEFGEIISGPDGRPLLTQGEQIRRHAWEKAWLEKETDYALSKGGHILDTVNNAEDIAFLEKQRELQFPGLTKKEKEKALEEELKWLVEMETKRKVSENFRLVKNQIKAVMESIPAAEENEPMNQQEQKVYEAHAQGTFTNGGANPPEKEKTQASAPESAADGSQVYDGDGPSDEEIEEMNGDVGELPDESPEDFMDIENDYEY